MSRSTVVLYIATSVDGFVATADGGVEWLDRFGDDEATAGYEAFFADVDCLLMGSRTYEQVLGFGEWPYGDRPTYVVTRRTLPRATDHVEFTSDAPDAVASDLADRYGTVWLVGGAHLAQSLLRAGRVDELRLTVAPTILGGGIHLFGEEAGAHELELRDTVAHPSGLVELRYGVASSE